jgi:hypothetical protein
MKVITTENYKNGLITSLDSREIPRGSVSKVVNWLVNQDKLELVRGIFRNGTDLGVGKVNGLFFTLDAGQNVRGWMKTGRKLYYWNSTTEDWVEIGSDYFPAVAVDDDMSFADYITNQGNQVWMSSPNSSLYKIMSANPESVVDQYNSTKNFKGYIDIMLNRMFLWKRKEDKTGVYGSYIDNLLNTQVTAEAIADTDTGKKHYTGTLAFKAGDAHRTCFAVSLGDGNEVFTDNFDGTLTSNGTGTGTINYATGEFVLDFNANTIAPVTATYQWEDATNKGIADFTKTSPTRVAGEGFVFRQDDAGPMMAVKTYNDIQYCIHKYKTYKLDIGSTDTTATNRLYRESVGIPNWRACCATGNGIYYIDDTDKNKQQFRLLTLDTNLAQVIPVTISKNLDLSSYSFSEGVVYEFYDYILFVGKKDTSTQNDITFVFNKTWKNWTKLDYAVSCLSVNNGELWGGDSLTKNVYTLFSGFDYDGEIITNEIELDFDDLDLDGYLKKVKRLPLEGFIVPDQFYDVEIDYDNSGFTKVGEVRGDATYVDKGISVSIGNTTIGSKVIGSSKVDSVSAYFYSTELILNSPKSERAKLRFVAQGIGYLSINKNAWSDVRLKSQRIPAKYRQ